MTIIILILGPIPYVNGITQVCSIMRAIVTLSNIKSNRCKHRIIRNLSRIMDIRIVDIDVKNKVLCFLYETPLAFQKVKKELWRIGYPIGQVEYQEPNLKSLKKYPLEHTALS